MTEISANEASTIGARVTCAIAVNATKMTSIERTPLETSAVQGCILNGSVIEASIENAFEASIMGIIEMSMETTGNVHPDVSVRYSQPSGLGAPTGTRELKDGVVAELEGWRPVEG